MYFLLYSRICLKLKVAKNESWKIYVNTTGESNGRDTEAVVLQHGKGLPRLVPCLQ